MSEQALGSSRQRRRRLVAEARRWWPASEQARRSRAGCECDGATRASRGCPGVASGIGYAPVIGLGRIPKADTYQPTYLIIAKIIKIRILPGYVSMPYRTRIRIRNVSDTRYAPSCKYPCNVANHSRSWSHTGHPWPSQWPEHGRIHVGGTGCGRTQTKIQNTL